MPNKYKHLFGPQKTVSAHFSLSMLGKIREQNINEMIIISFIILKYVDNVINN